MVSVSSKETTLLDLANDLKIVGGVRVIISQHLIAVPIEIHTVVSRLAAYTNWSVFQ
jgi:hypothetical protein